MSMSAQSVVEGLITVVGGLGVLTVAWQQTGYSQTFISGAFLGALLTVFACLAYERRQERAEKKQPSRNH